jgi:hypothetical protein
MCILNFGVLGNRSMELPRTVRAVPPFSTNVTLVACYKTR